MATERLRRRIDRLLDVIEEAADRDNWPDVQKLARQVLELEPNNVDAQTFMDLASLCSQSPTR